MDHNRDNPLKRFAAFWIAALLILSFAIACIILRPLTHGKVDSAYESRAEGRIALRYEAQSSQEASLSQEALSKTLASKASELLNQKPAPGNRAIAGAPAPADSAEGDSTSDPAE